MAGNAPAVLLIFFLENSTWECTYGKGLPGCVFLEKKKAETFHTRVHSYNSFPKHLVWETTSVKTVSQPYQVKPLLSTGGWTCHLLLKYLRCPPSESCNGYSSQVLADLSQCTSRWQSDCKCQYYSPEKKGEAKFFRAIQVFNIAQSCGAHPSVSIGCLKATEWTSRVGLPPIAVDGLSIHLPPFAHSEIHGCIRTQQLYPVSLRNFTMSLHLSASHLQVPLLNACTELAGTLINVCMKKNTLRSPKPATSDVKVLKEIIFK